MQSPHLIVPGWAGSPDEHWQTTWQHDLGAARVQLADWRDPDPAHWLDAIDRAIARCAQPPVVIAHSLGCIAVAHWARQTRRVVRAALLVAPADVERAACIAALRPFGPVPRTPLPFSSAVIASDNDPCVALERAEDFATAWGSELHVIERGGHLNAASMLGAWPVGRAILDRLLARTAVQRVTLAG